MHFFRSLGVPGIFFSLPQREIFCWRVSYFRFPRFFYFIFPWFLGLVLFFELDGGASTPGNPYSGWDWHPGSRLSGHFKLHTFAGTWVAVFAVTVACLYSMISGGLAVTVSLLWGWLTSHRDLKCHPCDGANKTKSSTVFTRRHTPRDEIQGLPPGRQGVVGGHHSFVLLVDGLQSKGLTLDVNIIRFSLRLGPHDLSVRARSEVWDTLLVWLSIRCSHAHSCCLVSSIWKMLT